MILIDRPIVCRGRGDEFSIYPLGDIHMGARNCAEKELRKVVKEIAENRNAYWVGGGDYLEAIKPGDVKRFDLDVIPDWMLCGEAHTIRKQLNDMVGQQRERLLSILKPIGPKCLGLIEGNHEYSIRKYHNEDHLEGMCNKLNCENLSDEAVIRLRFKRGESSRTVLMYIWHGHGGGRTYGAEPNHLGRLISSWSDMDIVFRGHSHTCCILPPSPVLSVPRSGALPKELTQKYHHAANWGCWKYSHMSGPSTYESRAGYPARPMITCKAMISPWRHSSHITEQVRIEIRQITL